MPTQLKGNQSVDEAEDLAEDQLALRKNLDLNLDSQTLNPFLVINFILSPCLSHQQRITVLDCFFKATALFASREYEHHRQWHFVLELLVRTTGRRNSVNNILANIKHCLCLDLLCKTQ